MNDTEPTPVRLIDSGAVRRAEKFQRAFEQRFPFARTWVTVEHGANPSFWVVVPRSYFEFRDPWLGYVVFGQYGTLAVVSEIRPDYSYCEVHTYLRYNDPLFEFRILGSFQEIIDRG